MRPEAALRPNVRGSTGRSPPVLTSNGNEPAMKRYQLGSRLPDLPLDPPEANTECNQCGALFNRPPPKKRDPDGWDDICPNCESSDIHRT